MAFTNNTKVQIYNNAGCRCQCTRIGCNHYGRCPQICHPLKNSLSALMGGDEYQFPGFEFHHIKSQEAGESDTAENGVLLCRYCHQQTNSYGNSLTR